MGNYGTFENLGFNSKSGLDIISHSRKIIIEIKNNLSSKKTNLDKLALFKMEYPDYMCILSTILQNLKQKKALLKLLSITELKLNANLKNKK